MGYCFSYDSLKTNNKSEDYCREILNTFKAREITIESISLNLLSLKEQTDRIDYLKKNIFDSSANNTHLKFHEAILNISNSTISFDNDQFSILKLLALAYNSENKLFFLKSFFHIETLEKLLLTIKTVILINLLSFNNIIAQIENNDEDMSKLIQKVYSQKNIDDFIDMLSNKIKLLISSSEENSIGNNDIFWIEARNILAFCLNCIELRHYFYLKYENAY